MIVPVEKRARVAEYVRKLVRDTAHRGYCRKIQEAVEKALAAGIPDEEIIHQVTLAVRRAKRKRSSLV